MYSGVCLGTPEYNRQLGGGQAKLHKFFTEP